MRDRNPPSLSRRRFLGNTGAAVAAFSAVPRHVLGGPNFVAPSAMVNIALIGAGGQGRTNARELFKLDDARIVAIADPIEHHDLSAFYYAGAAGRKPVKAEIEKRYGAKAPGFKCAEYEDFRVLFEKEPGIDAALCATPDHNHALITVTAMRLGKHVYCEKPLTHNVWEARLVSRVAQETGVATQLGNQGHSTDSIRNTVEWIRAGAIGPIREVHGWSSAGRWGKTLSTKPSERTPIPAGVNWDLWVGTREPKDYPYHPAYTPVTWRDFWAFGTAPIGDMAIHNLDPAFWALDLKTPATIEAFGAGSPDKEMNPFGTMYHFTFGARGEFPPLKLSWYDGGLFPPRLPELEDGEPMGANGNGVYFVGDKGKIVCPGWGGSPRVLPDSVSDAFKRPAPTLRRVKGHHRDWLDACKGGEPASSNFEYGAALTELVLLGTVALRTGKMLRWDAAGMKAKNAPEADAFLKDAYRKGWEVA